jgi:hypothetical protein
MQRIIYLLLIVLQGGFSRQEWLLLGALVLQ